MIPLFTCKACGFLSTLGSEFTSRQRVRFDNDCLENADAGREPWATWVRAALDKEAKARTITAEGADTGSAHADA